MLANTNKLKILLYGNVGLRPYRSKMLIKFFHDSNYCISQVSPTFYTIKNIKFFKNDSLVMLLCWTELFIKAGFADVIYLPPMNAKFIKSALWASRLFNKQLVVEIDKPEFNISAQKIKLNEL